MKVSFLQHRFWQAWGAISVRDETTPPLQYQGGTNNATFIIQLVSSRQVNEEGTELPAVVPLSVGGRRFLTRRSTLCKYEESMLAAMFSGRHTLDKDAHGKMHTLNACF